MSSIPEKWCLEVDFIAVGSGGGAITAAIAAHDPGKIEKPPFFGMKLIPTNCGVNAAGLKINTNGQVMSVRGKPIKGLYAAGNSAAHIDTGSGYQSGIANLRGVAWGWIAAHHAVGGKA